MVFVGKGYALAMLDGWEPTATYPFARTVVGQVHAQLPTHALATKVTTGPFANLMEELHLSVRMRG